MGAPYKTVCRVCGEPRDPNFDQALCPAHRREYSIARKAESRARQAPSYTPEYQRVTAYRAEAARQGATEAEGWWCAIAAEARFQQHGHSSRWLVAFIAAELAWLRTNADVLAGLDARQWQPVPSVAPIVDAGYDEDETEGAA